MLIEVAIALARRHADVVLDDVAMCVAFALAGVLVVGRLIRARVVATALVGVVQLRID